MKNNTLHRLSADELIALDSFLCNQTSDMSLVKAHGFITAVASFPDLFMPNEWIPILVGELKPFQDVDPAQEMLDKLLSVYRQTTDSLGSEGKFEFILSPEQFYTNLENAPYDYVEEWCNGYCLALVWNEEEWLHTKEEFITQACATFFMLTGLIKTNVKQQCSTEWKQDKSKLIKNLPELVKALYTYWLGKQDSMFSEGLRQLQNNQQCPCGSRKSYNNCCQLDMAESSIH